MYIHLTDPFQHQPMLISTKINCNNTEEIPKLFSPTTVAYIRSYLYKVSKIIRVVHSVW